jgi:hypothetical protein
MDTPVLWAKVSPGGWPQKRTIVIHPTGHEFEDYPGRYIGTFQMEGGMYVWHVYERYESRSFHESRDSSKEQK